MKQIHISIQDQSLLEIIDLINDQVVQEDCIDQPHQLIIQSIHPKVSTVLYDGEFVTHCQQRYRYRSFQTWITLAEELKYHVRDIQCDRHNLVSFNFEKYTSKSWHQSALPSGHQEKYGRDSEFTRINKLEEPSFLFHFKYALSTIKPVTGAQVLILGVNQGHEITALKYLSMNQNSLIHGIDHSLSAIKYAQESFQEDSSVVLEVGDLQFLDQLNLKYYDLIISINTLHSPHLNGQKIMRTLFKEHLKPNGSIILGFPQSRYQDFHLNFGLRTAIAHTVDMHKVFKGIYYYQRYFQQHQCKVELIGKYTALLIAQKLK